MSLQGPSRFLQLKNSMDEKLRAVYPYDLKDQTDALIRTTES